MRKNKRQRRIENRLLKMYKNFLELNFVKIQRHVAAYLTYPHGITQEGTATILNDQKLS